MYSDVGLKKLNFQQSWNSFLFRVHACWINQIHDISIYAK